MCICPRNRSLLCMGDANVQSRYVVTFIQMVYYHDDVFKWKYFPRYWPFVRGIQQWPVDSPHKGQWHGALIFSFIFLNKRLSKQLGLQWFETPSRSLRRHCNIWRKLNFHSHFMPSLNDGPNQNVENHRWKFYIPYPTWNGDVIISMIFPSMSAQKLVKMTNFGTASEENIIKMTTHPFQCNKWHCWYYLAFEGGGY